MLAAPRRTQLNTQYGRFIIRTRLAAKLEILFEYRYIFKGPQTGVSLADLHIHIVRGVVYLQVYNTGQLRVAIKLRTAGTNQSWVPV